MFRDATTDRVRLCCFDGMCFVLFACKTTLKPADTVYQLNVNAVRIMCVNAIFVSMTGQNTSHDDD